MVLITYDEVKSIIDEWDPAEFYGTVPSDEYDSESRKVFEALQCNKEIPELSLAIYNIFLKAFGDEVFRKNMEECTAVADRLLF